MKKRLRDSKSIEQDIPYGTAFTIGLISGMSQLYDRHSQFPVTFLYIAQKPAIVAGFSWWDYLDSNQRPLRCQRSALTS